ncbi:hypothetical protein EI541_18030 [Xanthomonas citri pv. eucalyptorum]|nr:hypothetical protein EI541_18030 [Xanthomonas axonopodis pv. eucalyptorum]
MLHSQTSLFRPSLMGFQTLIAAFLADLLSANRKLLEDIRSQGNVLTSHPVTLATVTPEQGC